MRVHTRRTLALASMSTLILAGCLGAPEASNEPPSDGLTPSLKPVLPTDISPPSNHTAPNATEPAPPDVAPSNVNVTIADRSFNPTIVTVASGTTVTWTNAERRDHTVTHLGGKFDSGIIGQDGSFSHAFNEPGTYFYVCQFHDDEFGRVIVEESA